MDYTRMVLENGHGIEMEAIPCQRIWSVNVFSNKDSSELVGQAILVEAEGRTEPVIWGITVFEEKNRRKGFGTDMVKFCQNMTNFLITGINSKAGQELCLKNGFELKKDLKDNYYLWWEDPDAKRDEKSVEEGSKEAGAGGESDEQAGLRNNPEQGYQKREVLGPVIVPTEDMRRVLQMCVDYYAKEGNRVGGELHVVLDDDNVADYFLRDPEKGKDPDTVPILEALRKLSMNQRIWVTYNIYPVKDGEGEREVQEEYE